jgi:hypothetical protein
MKYKIYSDRVKLFDSYLVPKAKFSRELGSIRNLHPSCRLWKRSENNIRREWAAHSLAYSLNICRNKTADVDLEYDPKWSMSVLYFIVGNIALLVIK